MWVYQEPEIQPIERGPITPPPSLPPVPEQEPRPAIVQSTPETTVPHIPETEVLSRTAAASRRRAFCTSSGMRASCGFLSLGSLYSGNYCRRFWIQQRWTCFPITCAVGAACLLSRALHRISTAARHRTAYDFGSPLRSVAVGVIRHRACAHAICFTMLYGAGAGLLTFQLFSGIPLPQALFFLFISGVPAALAAGALCWFGSCALEVSGRLHAFSLGRGRSPSCPCPAAIGTICTDRRSDASALRSRYLSCLFGQSAGRISVTVPCGHRRNVV